jgi:hypothetical protein
VNWIDLAQVRVRWRAILNKVTNLLVSIKCEKFIHWLKNDQLLRIDPPSLCELFGVVFVLVWA